MDSHELRQNFVERFGFEPKWAASAPGRVNLIGEHTDYNEGFVLPAAIDRRLQVLAAPSQTGESRICSIEEGGDAIFDLRSMRPRHPKNWGVFVAGIGFALQEAIQSPVPNLVALAHSTIPIGAGLSSSAAIEMAFARIWDAELGLGLSPKDLAGLGPASGVAFTGMKCGIMDQLASISGVRDHALFVDTRSLEVEPIPITGDLQLVACHTGRTRQLTDSAYNERREQCQAAAQALGVSSLREVPEGALDRLAGSVSDVILRRARHVLTENDRCRQMAQALRTGDRAQIFALMQASHLSLRDDYEVSCDELDAMAESAWDAPGCVGARMTGAGFGGCCVAIVDSGCVERFVARTRQSYEGRGYSGQFWACRADNGAEVRNMEGGVVGPQSPEPAEFGPEMG